MMRRRYLDLVGANINSGENTWETSPALVERRVHTCSRRMSSRCGATEGTRNRQGVPGVTSDQHLLIIDADRKADTIGNAAGVNDVEACLRIIDGTTEARHINCSIERGATHQQSMSKGGSPVILQ